MPSYTKLAGNARRFKTLPCLPTEKFDLLFARIEKARHETKRERLSKRPHWRAIGSGRRFALSGGHKDPSFFKRNVFQIGHGNDESLWPPLGAHKINSPPSIHA